MSGTRKITAGFMTDDASVNIANGILEMISDTDGGCDTVDFREDDRIARLKDKGQLKSLISMLTRNEIDIVISSMSALANPLPKGTELAAITRRGNPFNCLISSQQLILEEQPGNVPIAVADRVSMGQLLYFRPDLLIVEMKDGFELLDARLEKGEIGGFVAAAADVEAMSRQDKVVEVFTSSICLPVAGQGAVGIVTRKDDRKTKKVIDHVNHPPTWAEVELENIFLDQLPGRGKGTAVVLGSVDDDEFTISAAITAADGSEKISATMHGWRGEEKEITGKLATQLLGSGGEVLIREG